MSGFNISSPTTSSAASLDSVFKSALTQNQSFLSQQQYSGYSNQDFSNVLVEAGLAPATNSSQHQLLADGTLAGIPLSVLGISGSSLGSLGYPSVSALSGGTATNNQAPAGFYNTGAAPQDSQSIIMALEKQVAELTAMLKSLMGQAPGNSPYPFSANGQPVNNPPLAMNMPYGNPVYPSPAFGMPTGPSFQSPVPNMPYGGNTSAPSQSAPQLSLFSPYNRLNPNSIYNTIYKSPDNNDPSTAPVNFQEESSSGDW